MRSKNAEWFPMIERFINAYREQNSASPSVQEIADHIVVAKSTASRYRSTMREKGMIEYDGHRNIATRETIRTKAETVLVPILGCVSCGIPKFAEENIEEYVRLPIALFGKGDFFILRANGDSMVEANIDHGDLVVIRQQSHAEEGQIVVALIEDEATLKRYYPEPDLHRVRLHPENQNLQDIFVNDCGIQGVAVKVIKNAA